MIYSNALPYLQTSGSTESFLFSNNVIYIESGDSPELMETSIKEEKLPEVRLARTEFNVPALLICFCYVYVMVKCLRKTSPIKSSQFLPP